MCSNTAAKKKWGSKWADQLFQHRDVENGREIEEIHCSHIARKKKGGASDEIYCSQAETWKMGEQLRRYIIPTQQQRKRESKWEDPLLPHSNKEKGGTSEEIQCQTLCEYILFACCKYCNVTDQCRQKYYRLIWQIMESHCYCLSPWGNYYVRTLHIYTNIYYIGVFLCEQDRLLHKQGILEEPRLMFVW